MESSDHCPTCGRALESVFDFPRVHVISVRRLPLPEAMDSMSARAHEHRRASGRQARFSTGGLNLTPEIERACALPAVRSYFQRLEKLAGQVVAPKELLPSWKVDSYFRRAYPVPGTQLWMAIHESRTRRGGHRTADVDVLSKGVNLGSAGGPTLQVLGSLVRVEYEGFLTAET